MVNVLLPSYILSGSQRAWLLAYSLKLPYLQKGVRDAHFYHMGSDPSLQKTVMISVCLLLGLNPPQNPHQVIVCLSVYGIDKSSNKLYPD